MNLAGTKIYLGTIRRNILLWRQIISVLFLRRRDSLCAQCCPGFNMTDIKVRHLHPLFVGFVTNLHIARILTQLAG